MQKFNEIVQATMTEKNLRIADVARKTGYTWQHINDLLHNRRRWNEDTITKICDALGITIQFQATGTEN